MANVIVGVLAGIVAFALLLFAVAWATGAPSSPTGVLSGQINPAQSQTFSLTFTTQVASTAPPNSIWQLGSSIVYSVTESNAQGGQTNIAQNQHVATAVGGANELIYTLTATVTVTTVAVCTTACAGVVSNLTVTATALTWGGALSSPTVTMVFSSSTAYQNVPAVGPVNWNSYAQQAAGTSIAGIGFAIVAIVVGAAPHKVAGSFGVVAIIVGLLVLIFV